MTKITSLTAQTSAGGTDNLPIVDNSATPTTKKITWANLIKSIISQTKGNLPVSDGTTLGALGVGTNNQVLTADSSQTYGLKWANAPSGGSAGDMVYPLDVTIGDYSAPSAATSSSVFGTTENFASYHGNQSAADAVWVSNDTAKIRVNVTNDNLGATFDTASAMKNIYYDLTSVSDITFKVRFTINWSTKTGAANSYFYIGLSDGSATDTNSAQDFIGVGFHTNTNKYFGDNTDGAAPSGNQGASNSVAFTPSTGTTYYFEVERTDSTHYIVRRYSDNTYTTVSDNTGSIACGSTTQTLRYFRVFSANDTSVGNNTFVVDDVVFFVNSAPFVYDGNTSTFWKSAQENTPNIYVDLTSARDIASVAINLNKTATTETVIKIQTSNDASSWTTKRYINVSDFTNNTWRFFPINRPSTDNRYVRIIGNSNSVILAIYEIKVYYSPTTTDWNRTHWHYKFSTTASDNTNDSN